MMAFACGVPSRWASLWILSFLTLETTTEASLLSVSKRRSVFLMFINSPISGWNNNYIDLIRDDPSRTLMGSRQENWFYRTLSESKNRGAKWRVVGNQIIFSRIFTNDAGAMSGDNWSVSYPAIPVLLFMKPLLTRFKIGLCCQPQPHSSAHLREQDWQQYFPRRRQPPELGMLCHPLSVITYLLIRL